MENPSFYHTKICSDVKDHLLYLMQKYNIHSDIYFVDFTYLFNINRH